MLQNYRMPKDHCYIFFHSGMYRDCDCPDHRQLFLSHHRQACWYSTHRFWICASLSGAPGARIFFGYPFFYTDAASVSFFPISFLLFPDTQKRSHPHVFLLHILVERLSQSEIVLPLRKICYYLPLAEVGVFSTEINFLPRTVPSDRIMV